MSSTSDTSAIDEKKGEDTESEDINLVIGGSSSIVADTAAAHDTHVTMITNLVEGRKDCVGFTSPYRSATVGVTTSIQQAENVRIAANLCPSSSYMVMDSGYMYMYDKYNDVYRYVPLNGDMAGLTARTDLIADSWFSPAGFNRGVVRGAVKLAFNPTKTQRDELYPKRINPAKTIAGITDQITSNLLLSAKYNALFPCFPLYLKAK